MQYPTVIVNGVSVRVDDAGRYSLNDLHVAAVANGEATESQRPSVFLRSAQIKRFVKALEAKALKSASEQNQPLRITKVVRKLVHGELNFWLFAMLHGLNLSSRSAFTEPSGRRC